MRKYLVSHFKYQNGSTWTQAVESFKKVCRKFAGNNIRKSEYGSDILPDEAILKAIIANRDVKKYEAIIREIAAEYFDEANVNENFAPIILAALSFLPNDTTVSRLMPLLKPFDMWQDLVERCLRGMVMTGKIYNCDLCAGLDNISVKKI